MLEFLKNPLTSLLEPSYKWTKAYETLMDCEVNFLDYGVIEIIPKNYKTDKALVLSCGIHGNETAPIEIICGILQDIGTKSLKPQLPLLIQFGNIEAMRTQKRFVEFNLNRLFSGNHASFSTTQEAPRAVLLEKSMTTFAKNFSELELWHFDLHTAIRGSFHKRFAMRPFRVPEHFRKDEEISPIEMNLLSDFGIEAVVQSHAPNTTYSSYSCSQHRAISFTMELGKVEPFGKNKKEDFLRADNGLRSFLTQGRPSQKKSNESSPLVYKVVDELIREDESTTLHLPDDYHNFMPLEVGQPIQTTNEKTRMATQGEAVIFPNPLVKVGQRTGLIISASGSL